MFDPLEFLEIADALATGDVSEVEARTAMGRYYYGCFLAARRKAGYGYVGTARPRKIRHRDLIDLWKDSDNPQIGILLDTLFSERLNSDYKDHIVVDPGAVSSARNTAWLLYDILKAED